ncbi:MAG TPA: mycothiol system anti-sigma-R factor [Pseudonocardiaceae bacterium]|nr:mycothiol system anti-sigma-R factor [Pseudonocardiaceae bacterium]
MSCGQPHEMDCREMLAEVWTLLDHECDEDYRHKLEQHLDECSPCLEQYGLEEKLKLLFARKCGGDHASVDFRERLRAAIREAVVRRPDGTTVEIVQTAIEVRREQG